MNEINQQDKKEVICKCSGTTKCQILELIANGVNDLDRISRTTGACSGCGSCDYDITKLITENN